MAKLIDGIYWENTIIQNDAIWLGKRIKFFMEEGIPFRIEIIKGIYGEDLVNLLYLPPKEGIDFMKLYKKEAV